MATGSTIRLATSLLVGISAGLGSAHYMSSPSNPVISERHANWYMWPAPGDPESSPYSQSKFLLAGHLPEHFSEVTTLYRSHDDDGGQLSSDCVYLLSMKRPALRRWTISLLDGTGTAVSVLTQDTIISSGGTVDVRLASTPQPGNWLRFGPDGTGQLVLRLYDGEDRPPGTEQTEALLPTLRQESCS